MGDEEFDPITRMCTSQIDTLKARIAELEDELSECEFCKEPMVAGEVVKPFICVACWNAAIEKKDKRIAELEAELTGRRGNTGNPAPLPCPFCGGNVGYVTSLHGYRVVCDACDIHGPRGTSSDEARAKWNQRRHGGEEE